MARVGRAVHVFLLLSCVAIARPQGSAGGYGQGGGQGGFGGGGGGFGGGGFGGNDNAFNQNENEKHARPDEDETAGLWKSKTAVLTPGDRVEFKLKMQRGETLMASVTSDAFDPALSVEDDKAKVLAKNDDRAEGDQSPFIIFCAPEAGTYTLKVLSYRSVSGGKFTARMRTFLPIDASFGPTKYPVPKSEERRMVFRIGAKKGSFYDLRRMIETKPYVARNDYLRRLIGPTGVEANDFQVIPTGDGMPVFLALTDGDYYVEYERTEATEVKTDFHELTAATVNATGELLLDLQPGELKIIEFAVQANQIIRTKLSNASINQRLSAPSGTDRSSRGDTGEGDYGDNPAWTWFAPNRDSQLDVVRVFHGTGTARLTIRSNSSSAEKVTVKNTESLPEWASGQELAGKMEIGDSKLFLIKSSKSELMKVSVTATHFQPKLDIYRLNGDLANSIMNRKAHDVKEDLYFPETDIFVARLTCDGFGGSGDFVMKRGSVTPTPYKLGSVKTMMFKGDNFGLYAVDLEAGKRYQLTSDGGIRADLLDDEGQFLISRAMMFDKVEVQYFVPTRSGRHRLWLRGASGERRFKFDLHVPPSLGGGG